MNQRCGGQQQCIVGMIINVCVVHKQAIECKSICVCQRCVRGEVVLVNQTHDVAVDIAVVGAGESAVFRTTCCIRFIIASEGDLVTDFGK